MRYIRPKYYDDFTCTADKCPDTCCAGWQIMIDEDSLEEYGKVQGSFGRRLRSSIDWAEGAFYQYDRRCAFLNEDNLCDLYTALGSDSLCDTCRNYPRHVEEYEGLREKSLSLSCPVAAEMILSQKGFPEFVVTEDDKEEELEEEFEDFDLLLFTQLEDARNAILEQLKNGCDTVQEKMSQALELSKEMQECVEDGRYFEIEETVRRYQSAEEIASGWQGTDRNVGIDMARNLELYHTMYRLERLREDWTAVLEEAYQVLYASGEDAYVAIVNEFARYRREDPEAEGLWEDAGLQLFVFFLYTYFCGAVYDDWICSKMALAVYSVEFIRELLMVRWKNRGKLTFADYVELAYRYAREIEHSDQNLNDLEEIFMEKIMKIF